MSGGALDTAGRYAIEGVLGQGAMSVVYRATDTRTGRPVALKLLRSELLAAAERNAVLARFHREADIGLRLDHPNIVRVYDQGEFSGSPYLAMELIGGRDLKAVMEADAPDEAEAVALMLGVLDALDYAHRHGVVHRDIKPANIVVQQDGTPKLTDFGIAQVSQSDLTQTGELLGTPAYMAPEVLRGEAADPRSDLFSTGVLLYYLLARRRPFSGSVATVMQQILFADPPPPSEANPQLPPPFDRLIQRALAKVPNDRYPDAGSFAGDLRQALSMLSGGARPVVPAGRRVSPTETTWSAGPGRDALLTIMAEALRSLTEMPLDEHRLASIEGWLAAWQNGTGGDAARWQELLLTAGVEPLAALIAASVPSPRAPQASQRRDWMPMVRLLAALSRALAGSPPPNPAGDRARMATSRIAFDLSSRFFVYSGVLNQELMAGDNPDIMMLSLDFLRLEVLQHALEELGAEAELHSARNAMLMFAVQVMRKVNQIMRACTDGNDGLARFGVAVILSNIEELIVIAGRLFELNAPGGGSKQGAAAGGAGPAGGVPREVVAEFIAAAGRFATLSVEELRGEVASGEGTPDSFAARLRGVGALYLFATRLIAEDCAPLMRGLVNDLYGLVAALTADLGTAAIRDPGARMRLAALAEMAGTLHWGEVERMALTALRLWAMSGEGAGSQGA